MALASRPAVDPVKARLTQLGAGQARNLEELELQQPFFERTIRPLAGRLSGWGQPAHESSPANPERRSDWPWPAIPAT